jgi:small subunit ribosomal protein S4
MVKLSRREGVALTDKCQKYLDRRPYPPGEHGRWRIRQSEYLLQLREKQKTRRFSVAEKQFRRYYQKAKWQRHHRRGARRVCSSSGSTTWYRRRGYRRGRASSEPRPSGSTVGGDIPATGAA